MQRNPFREGRTHTLLHEIIANFITEVSGNESLITISYVHLNRSGTLVSAYCFVFPDEQKNQAISFLQRKEKSCRSYIRTHTNLRTIPAVSFLAAKTLSEY